VYAAGEEWSARSADDRPLERGTPVRVVRQDGLTLIVEPMGDVQSAAVSLLVLVSVVLSVIRFSGCVT